VPYIALPHALARLGPTDELVLIQVVAAPPEEPAARESLERIAASLADHAPRVTVVVRSGAAAHEILAALEERQPDLLVIASHGHNGWQRARLGSVAEEVTRRSPCPVWLVRAQHKQAPSWTPSSRPSMAPPTERRPWNSCASGWSSPTG